MKKVLIAVLVVAMAVTFSAVVNAASIDISGYIDVGYTDVQGGGAPDALGADPLLALINSRGDVAQNSSAIYATNGSSAVLSAVTPGAAAATAATITGGAGFYDRNGGVQGNGNRGMGGNSSWLVNEVNLDVTATLTDNISTVVSLDFVPGSAPGTPAAATSTVVDLDLAYIDFVNPGPADVTLRVGKFPSVIGIEYRQNESPDRINISRSLVSRYTTNEITGVQVRGSIAPVTYQFALTNSSASRGYDVNSATAGLGDNRMTISGRLAVIPVEGIEVGVSGSYGGSEFNAANINSVDPMDETLVGADISYVAGPLAVRAEFVDFHVDDARFGNAGVVGAVSSGIDQNAQSFYVEGSYDWSDRLTAYIRFSQLKNETIAAAGVTPAAIAAGGDPFTGAQTAGVGTRINTESNSIAVAGKYKVSDNVSVKAEYQLNDDQSTIGGGPVGQVMGVRDQDLNVLTLSAVATF